MGTSTVLQTMITVKFIIHCTKFGYPIHLLTGGPRKPDTWLLQKWHDDGFTSEFDEFVSDPTAELTTRIDHIFLAKQYAEREFSSFFGAAHQAADLE